MRLTPGARWQGRADVMQPAAGVLSAGVSPSITAPMQMFTPAEPAIALDVQMAPSAVLGAEEQAAMEYKPEDDAVYVLMHEMQTSGGTVYDITLPQPMVSDGPSAAVLSSGATQAMLRFPINMLTPSAAGPAPGVLGVEELIGEAVGGVIVRRILQIVKSPFDHALLNTIRRAEGEPQALALREGALRPLDGAEAWRSLLPPGQERRALLFIHGFGSSVEGTRGDRFLPLLGGQYDAILGYNHPTVSRDPLQNALDLLQRIPDDLRLSVDIVAHSRGGLVARSLIELAAPAAHIIPRCLITNGTPHNGTRLADPQRWDRLISICLTVAHGLTIATGAAFWTPLVLEFVLKAAAQSIFSLPGIIAMTPGSDFLSRLNAPTTYVMEQQVCYAAVRSTFDFFGLQEGFRLALKALSAQAFIDEPNDLIVPTASMNAIDTSAFALAPERQLATNVDHFTYFDNEAVLEFLRQQLA
jgi:hypothetical protein